MINHPRMAGILAALGIVLILVPCGVGQEKEPQRPAEQAGEGQAQDQQEQEEQGRARSTSAGSGESESRASRSFADGVFGDWRNPLGFSLGVYEIYARDRYPSSGLRDSAMITSFYPRLSANFGRRRSRLHLDYGFGYGFENQDTSQDTQEHSANATYTYQASRKTSLRISDRFLSSPNYYGSILNAILGSGPIYHPGYISEAYRPGQSMLRNQLGGDISRDLGRKASISAFSSYNLYRYETSGIYDGDAVSAGASIGYQAKKRLSLQGSYSRYWNMVDSSFSDAVVDNFQAGLQFQLAPGWLASVSGGFQISDYYENAHKMGTVLASLSRSSTNTTLSITYYRGFSTAVGLSRLYQSNSVTIAFGQRLARRISFVSNGSYYNNSEVEYSGGYEYWLVRAGLEFLLRRDLAAVVQYAYQYQKNGQTGSADVIDVNRNLVYFGLQYIWPATRR